MTNYFDSIKLYSWNMNERQIERFEKKVEKLDWKILLLFQLALTAIFSITFALSLEKFIGGKIVGDFNSYLITLFPNAILAILFLFGGYYFTKLFFENKMDVFKFYSIISYLYMPIILINTIIASLALVLSYSFGPMGFIVYVLYFPLAYYAVQEIVTSLSIFTKEFNTSNLKIIGVVILWGVLTSIFSNLINKAIFGF